MKLSTVLKITLLAAQCGAANVVDIPLNLRIQDTEIPLELAQSLVTSTRLQLSLDKRYERLFIDRNGISEEYLCAIPPANSTLPEIAEAATIEHEEDSTILARAIDLVHSSFLSDHCVYSYDLRGFYWTYGYCHGDKIIQYHEVAPFKDRPHKHEAGAPNTVYVLGRFSKASNKEVSFSNQVSPIEMQTYIRDSARTFRLVDEKVSPFSHLSQKVLLQMATDGSICDMTWQPRSTEVVYKCDANGGKLAHILDVEEIKTCHYRLFVHVPSLCHYKPFVPDKAAEDLVDVTCQRVAKHPGYALDGLATFEDYSDHQVLRQNSPFPVPSDNRIVIAMHTMVALSRGFYIAKYNGDYHTASDFYNHRNVILFNGFHTSLVDLNLQLGRTVFNSIGKNFLAPLFNGNEQVMLSWKHSFIMWFEVYNFKGELLGISRLLRDGSKEKKLLSAQMFDPVTLLDVDGDDSMSRSFVRPEFEAPYNMWNFEMFLANSQIPVIKKPTSNKKKIPEDIVELTQTVIVYNDGVMADGSPNVEVYEERTGEKLPGQYNKKGEYVFTYEPNPGQTETFTALLMPGVEFYGYPITYLEPRNLAEGKMLEETVTVTQTAEREAATGGISSGEFEKEENAKNDAIQGIEEVEQVSHGQAQDDPDHNLYIDEITRENEELLEKIVEELVQKMIIQPEGGHHGPPDDDHPEPQEIAHDEL